MRRRRPPVNPPSDVEAQDGDEQSEPAEQPVTVAEEEAEPTRRRWGFGLRNRRGR